MKRPLHLWLAFTLCLAVVLVAMGWISVTAMRLDRAQTDATRQKDGALRQADTALRKEAASRRREDWEQNVRLALWRIDTSLAPLITQESILPYTAYRSFLSPSDAPSNMALNRQANDGPIPSPLLMDKPAHVLTYFQFEPNGTLASPQVPVGVDLALAVPDFVSQEFVLSNGGILNRVGRVLDRDALLAQLPQRTPERVNDMAWTFSQTPDQRDANRDMQHELQRQGRRGTAEQQARFQTIIGNYNNRLLQNTKQFAFNPFALPLADATNALMTPVWVEDHLVLARRAVIKGDEYIQGCVLDWPMIKTALLDLVEDLLPEADLQPATRAVDEDDPRMLVALPVRLVPGEPPAVTPAVMTSSHTPSDRSQTGGFLSSIRLSLGVAWACVLLAAAAVAVLLWGVLRLSERRASFVTAVTHELRTPLTTFQMYAEMLAEGMVTNEQQRQEYLATLQSESGRLVHLVENVLSYARLERGRTNGLLTTATLDELVTPVVDRLTALAKQAGMEFSVEATDEARELAVRANVSTVEQVLVNLVDNACKYATGTTDNRVRLQLCAAGRVGELAIRDHGPGIARDVRRKLFRSFSKSAPEAARSAPGVGLGLALSRRLAHDMGGDLVFDGQVSDGARFVLSLMAAE